MRYTLEWMMKNAFIIKGNDGQYRLYEKSKSDDDYLGPVMIGRYDENGNIFAFPVPSSRPNMEKRKEFMKNFKAFLTAKKLAGEIE